MNTAWAVCSTEYGSHCEVLLSSAAAVLEEFPSVAPDAAWRAADAVIEMVGFVLLPCTVGGQ